MLPLTCLVIGDAVLGADLRAGTFTFPWLSPVPFPTIVIGRWLGGWESQQVYAGLADDAGGWRLLRDGTPSGWGAVVRLATVLVVTLAVAVWRLAHLKPTGGDE